MEEILKTSLICTIILGLTLMASTLTFLCTTGNNLFFVFLVIQGICVIVSALALDVTSPEMYREKQLRHMAKTDPE